MRPVPITTVPQKTIYFKIPYYGPYSYVMKRKISQLFTKFYPQIKLRILLENTNTISKLFRFKDRLPTNLSSGIVYKYSCGECSASYVGKTQRHLITRISEHKGMSVRTGMHLTNPSFSNIREHAFHNNHRILDKNFNVIAKSAWNEELLILESLLIHQHKPSLNEYSTSTLEFL